MTFSRTIRAGARLATIAVLCAPGLAGPARAAALPAQATYLYRAGERQLGSETFQTVALADSTEVRGQTELLLDAYFLSQTSVLRYGPDGSTRSVSVAGEMDDSPFGFQASIGSGSLRLVDTPTGFIEQRTISTPLRWVTGNFVHHLLVVLTGFDDTAVSTQDFTTQAGPLFVRRMNPATIVRAGVSKTVERLRVDVLGEGIEILRDGAGQVLLVEYVDQGVRAWLSGWEMSDVRRPAP